MLEAMKRGAQTWVAKILLALLVLSFAVWGIADVFVGGGNTSVATVGETQITSSEVQRAFQNELDRFARENNTSQRLTPEQGRALGIDRRVLNQLIGGAAIEAHADDMGLRLSDSTIVQNVRTDPDFQVDGKFSREGFEMLLRQADLSEKGFVQLRRKDELRTHIISAFVNAQTVPDAMIEMTHDYEQEKRKIEWLTINANEAVEIKEPDEAKLREIYEKDKEKFKTPEYRTFEVLILDKDTIKPQLEIGEDEIRQQYEQTKESYNTPEKRRVQQLAFQDKDKAEAARKAIAEGEKTFAKVAEEIGAKTTDVDLGLVTRDQLIDSKVAEAAFALEKEKISDVVEGRFTNVVLRVTQIEPGIEREFKDVEDQVRDAVAEKKARVEVPLLFDKIEDLRAQGKSLQEVAREAELEVKKVTSNRRGTTPDNKPAMETPDLRKIIARIFPADESIEEDLVDLTGGGYAWLNRISSEAPKQVEFDKVKEDITSNYIKEQRTKKLEKLARELAKKLADGVDKKEIEEAAKAKFSTSEPFTRKTEPQGISASVVAQAFGLAEGKASSAVSSDKNSQTVFRVVEIIPAPKMTDAQRKQIRKRLQSELVNQALNDYTMKLRAELGTSVNEEQLRRTLGINE